MKSKDLIFVPIVIGVFVVVTSVFSGVNAQQVTQSDKQISERVDGFVSVLVKDLSLDAKQTAQAKDLLIQHYKQVQQNKEKFAKDEVALKNANQEVKKTTDAKILEILNDSQEAIYTAKKEGYKDYWRRMQNPKAGEPTQ